MREIITNLGKIGITVEGEYDETTIYKRLSIVNDSTTGKVYISKTDVPRNTSLNDDNYWMPLVLNTKSGFISLKDFNIENDLVTGYIKNVNYNTENLNESFIYKYSKVEVEYRTDQPKPIELEVEGNEFIYSETPTMNRYNTVNIIRNKVVIYNLIPNKIYYYCTDIDNSIRIFKVEGTVRMIKLDSIKNVRDLGGKNTIYGKHIKYGKIYKGSALIDKEGLAITEEDKKYLINDLNIKTELDLRYDEERFINVRTETLILNENIGYYSYNIPISEMSSFYLLNNRSSEYFINSNGLIKILDVEFESRYITKEDVLNYINERGYTDNFYIASSTKTLIINYYDTIELTKHYKLNYFPSFNFIVNIPEINKNELIKAINLIIDNTINNNPVYFHCVWGAHRAGLLSTIIYGLLGVSQNDIDKDYELSAFAGYSNMERCSNVNSYFKTNKYIKEYYGNWYNWCIEILNLNKNDIEKFRYAMIEDYGQSELEYLTDNDIDELWGAPYDINSNAPSYVGEL